MDTTPDVIADETTDPNPAGLTTDPAARADTRRSETLKDVSERTGWIQVIVLAAFGIFVAGGTSYAVVGRLATKVDLEMAMRMHASAPPDPRIIVRLDEIERWRVAHEAEHRSDLEWLKRSMDEIKVLIDKGRRENSRRR